MNIKRVNCLAISCALLAVWLLIGCTRAPGEAEKRAVLTAYKAQAFAVYDDALVESERLYEALQALVEKPSERSLKEARSAWRAARVPYSQTEALRFGNWFVDRWEEKINRWPIDEGFIDYVDDRYRASASHPWSRANIIAAEHIEVLGRPVPLAYMVHKQLAMLEQESGIEGIVASGYHAIEFMLWGQDVSSVEPFSGQRPWTDFANGELCSDGAQRAPNDSHCRKRREFLLTLSVQLLSTLQEMREHWSASPGSPGSRLVAGDPNIGIGRMLLGLAAMSGEELAGERVQAALLSGSPEEEQDCFSDDSHQSLWYNALGVENFYYGRYEGRQVFSAEHSLAAMARRHQPQLAEQLDAAFAQTKVLISEVRGRALRGEQYFDQLITSDPALLKAVVEALQHQAALLEKLAARVALPLNDPRLLGDY